MNKSVLINTISSRERFRDAYFLNKDPIFKDRLLWRAQTFRHLVHLVPGETILEIGCGKCLFTNELYHVSKGKNPITAVTFCEEIGRPSNLPTDIDFFCSDQFPGILKGKTFDYIVVTDLLDKRNCSELLQILYEFLRPGGQLLFYESNPWNPFLKLKRLFSLLRTNKDHRNLLNRPQLYELISAVGFTRVFVVFNDFVYSPLSSGLIWALRNLSILLENAPFIRIFSGSILIHAQKPPHVIEKPTVSLFEHENLKGRISVVIPCHNEEMNINKMINGLLNYYDDYLKEVILVDDNSTDGTRAILENLSAKDSRIKPIFRRPPNGVGLALKDGFKVASGDYILSMDCDFQHLLPELKDLFDAAAEGYDLVTGSRFSKHSVLLNYPFMKILANRGFHFIAHFILWRRFRDLTNNLKLIKREVLNQLILTQDGFAINAEVGFQPLVMGCSIKEVPISWINRTPDMGVSSFQLVRVGGGYWTVLFQLLLRNVFHAGAYNKIKTIGKNRATVRQDN